MTSRATMKFRLGRDAYEQSHTPFSDALGRAHKLEILEKDQLLRRSGRWFMGLWLGYMFLALDPEGVWSGVSFAVVVLGISFLLYRERKDRRETQMRIDRTLATHWMLEHS